MKTTVILQTLKRVREAPRREITELKRHSNVTMLKFIQRDANGERATPQGQPSEVPNSVRFWLCTSTDKDEEHSTKYTLTDFGDNAVFSLQRGGKAQVWPSAVFPSVCEICEMFQICTWRAHKSQKRPCRCFGGVGVCSGLAWVTGPQRNFSFSVCCCLTERSVVHGRCLGHLNKDILSCPLGAECCGENVSRKVSSPGSELLNPPPPKMCGFFGYLRASDTSCKHTKRLIVIF